MAKNLESQLYRNIIHDAKTTKRILDTLNNISTLPDEFINKLTYPFLAKFAHTFLQHHNIITPLDFSSRYHDLRYTDRIVDHSQKKRIIENYVDLLNELLIFYDFPYTVVDIPLDISVDALFEEFVQGKLLDPDAMLFTSPSADPLNTENLEDRINLVGANNNFVSDNTPPAPNIEDIQVDDIISDITHTNSRARSNDDEYVTIISGRKTPLSSLKIKCSFSHPYVFPDSSYNYIIQDTITMADHEQFMNVAEIFQLVLMSGHISLNTICRLKTMLVLYGAGFAREIEIGKLQRITTKVYLGTTSPAIPPKISRDQLLLKENGLFYWQVYNAIHQYETINELGATQLIESMLCNLLIKYELFSDSSIDSITPICNIEFVQADKNVGYSDITNGACAINFSKLFSNRHVLTSMHQTILSSIALQVYNSKIRISTSKNESAYYKWTLFPVKQMRLGDTIRMEMRSALVLLIILNEWIAPAASD